MEQMKLVGSLHRILLSATALGLLAVLACGDNGASPDTTTATAAAQILSTSTPIVETRLHPPGTRTSIPAIDQFLALRDGRDTNGISGIIEYRLRPCTTAVGIDVVNCREGEPTGTMVEVLRFGGCEVASERTGSPVTGMVIDDLVSPGLQLYAVLRSDDGGYLVYFARDAEDLFPRIVFLTAQGRIWSFGSTCAKSAVETVSQAAPQDVVFAPRQ